MSENRLDRVLSELDRAWETMLIPNFKKRQWKYLQKHIETIYSPDEWKRVFSEFYPSISTEFTKNPLTEAERDVLIERGKNLFQKGLASRLRFLAIFYEGVGGQIIERFDFPEASKEIRCIASFIAASIEAVLKPDEEFISVYEGHAHITKSSWAKTPIITFNIKFKSLIFVTSQRIFVFGRFPNLPSYKMVKLYFEPGLFRIYYPNIVEQEYLEGLDIIRLKTIHEAKASKNRVRISFKSKYWRLSFNFDTSFLGEGAKPNSIAITLHEQSKGNEPKNGMMEYSFLLTSSKAVADATRCVENIQGLNPKTKDPEKEIVCPECKVILYYQASSQEKKIKCHNCDNIISLE